MKTTVGRAALIVAITAKRDELVSNHKSAVADAMKIGTYKTSLGLALANFSSAVKAAKTFEAIEVLTSSFSGRRYLQLPQIPVQPQAPNTRLYNRAIAQLKLSNEPTIVLDDRFDGEILALIS